MVLKLWLSVLLLVLYSSTQDLRLSELSKLKTDINEATSHYFHENTSKEWPLAMSTSEEKSHFSKKCPLISEDLILNSLNLNFYIYFYFLPTGRKIILSKISFFLSKKEMNKLMHSLNGNISFKNVLKMFEFSPRKASSFLFENNVSTEPEQFCQFFDQTKESKLVFDYFLNKGSTGTEYKKQFHDLYQYYRADFSNMKYHVKEIDKSIPILVQHPVKPIPVVVPIDDEKFADKVHSIIKIETKKIKEKIRAENVVIFDRLSEQYKLNKEKDKIIDELRSLIESIKSESENDKQEKNNLKLELSDIKKEMNGILRADKFIFADEKLKDQMIKCLLDYQNILTIHKSNILFKERETINPDQNKIKIINRKINQLETDFKKMTSDVLVNMKFELTNMFFKEESKYLIRLENEKTDSNVKIDKIIKDRLVEVSDVLVINTVNILNKTVMEKLKISLFDNQDLDHIKSKASQKLTRPPDLKKDSPEHRNIEQITTALPTDKIHLLKLGLSEKDILSNNLPKEIFLKLLKEKHLKIHDDAYQLLRHEPEVFYNLYKAALFSSGYFSYLKELRNFQNKNKLHTCCYNMKENFFLENLDEQKLFSEEAVQTLLRPDIDYKIVDSNDKDTIGVTFWQNNSEKMILINQFDNKEEVEAQAKAIEANRILVKSKLDKDSCQTLSRVEAKKDMLKATTEVKTPALILDEYDTQLNRLGLKIEFIIRKVFSDDIIEDLMNEHGRLDESYNRELYINWNFIYHNYFETNEELIHCVQLLSRKNSIENFIKFYGDGKKVKYQQLCAHFDKRKKS